MVANEPRKGGTYSVDPKTGEHALIEGSLTEPRPTQAQLEAATQATAVTSVATAKASESAPETISKS